MRYIHMERVREHPNYFKLIYDRKMSSFNFICDKNELLYLRYWGNTMIVVRLKAENTVCGD